MRTHPEDLLWGRREARERGDLRARGRRKGEVRTGESSTEPTELMLVRRRKSSPIFFMISLWFMSILPVSLMISGMSFVSSIVADIRFSNWDVTVRASLGATQARDGGLPVISSQTVRGRVTVTASS